MTRREPALGGVLPSFLTAAALKRFEWALKKPAIPANDTLLLRALLIANRTTLERRGKLALCGVIGEVKRLFDIGNFNEEFLICPSQAEGIGKLRA